MKTAVAFTMVAVLVTGSLLPSELVSLPDVPVTPVEPIPPSEDAGRASPAPKDPPATPAAVTPPDPSLLFSPADAKLLQDLQAGAGERQIYSDIQDHFHEAGFKVPSSSELNEFSENETISFPYNVGDVDHDGIDDVLLDTFCNDFDGCFKEGGCPFPPSLTDLECLQKPPELRLMKELWCLFPHRIYMRSGVNGTELWRRDMSMRTSYIDETNPDAAKTADALTGMCFYEFLVGEMPSPDGGETVLIYRVRVTAVPRIVDDRISGQLKALICYILPCRQTGPRGTDWVFEHFVYAIDRLNGKELWRSPVYVGFCQPFILLLAEYCESVIVNPILQVPPEQGVRVVPEKTQPALFLQGIGFNAEVVPGAGGPTESGARTVVFDYQPREWAVRLDLVTGQEIWKNDKTFTPYEKGPDLSVRPRALPERMGPFWAWGYEDIPVALSYYWDYVPCCFDLTGDTIPDMVYTTREWNNKPSYNTGPFFISAHLTVFDGSSGKRLWDVVMDDAMPWSWIDETNSAPGALATFELYGDANADRVSDILIHRMYFKFDYVNVIEVYDGLTGKRLWSYESPRNLRTVVLGDTNGDGSNDCLLVDWFDWEHVGIVHPYDYANVTKKHLILVNGMDGKALWRAETFSAPIDLTFLVSNYRTNGVPDLNGDGIGEFPADDPLVLPDLTLIHRWAFLDGVTGQPLRRIVTVGQFSVPAWGGNLTGNRFDDLLVTSGDSVDLWMSLYDGETAKALWSRRVMTPRVSEYTLAIPYLRHIPLERRNQANDTFLAFHFAIENCASTTCRWSFVPQLAPYANANGTSAWAYPEFFDPNLTFMVWGPSPASFAFEKLLDEQARAVGYAAATISNVSYVVPGMVCFLATVLLGLGVSRRWWPK